MRIAVISDIHANVIALQRVLKKVDALQPDALWCLGDVVGYGPEPEACVSVVRKRAAICLAGNHDLATIGALDLARFNPVAREAILWQRDHLSEDSMTWLATLPVKTARADVTLAHGSPRSPEWEYVDDASVAADNYDAFETALCLIGHSHLAIAWRLYEQNNHIHAELRTESRGQPLPLTPQDKWLLNPGSVGQPRDGDPRAAFALLDTDARQWTWFRLAYDIEAVEDAIIAAGLPALLGRRLHLGW
ncbi:MAG: metallophosphoesterase [Clostridia bacterium]|nr:MAG: metallophosphoesterase [Clostridia bacterium]